MKIGCFALIQPFSPMRRQFEIIRQLGFDYADLTGMFGIVPTGLDSFECTPWLPKDWPRMALRDLRAFGRSWDLVVERVGDQQKVTVLSGGKALMTGLGPAGKTYALTFPNRKNETQKQ